MQLSCRSTVVVVQFSKSSTRRKKINKLYSTLCLLANAGNSTGGSGSGGSAGDRLVCCLIEAEAEASSTGFTAVSSTHPHPLSRAKVKEKKTTTTKSSLGNDYIKRERGALYSSHALDTFHHHQSFLWANSWPPLNKKKEEKRAPGQKRTHCLQWPFTHSLTTSEAATVDAAVDSAARPPGADALNLWIFESFFSFLQSLSVQASKDGQAFLRWSDTATIERKGERLPPKLARLHWLASNGSSSNSSSSGVQTAQDTAKKESLMQPEMMKGARIRGKKKKGKGGRLWKIAKRSSPPPPQAQAPMSTKSAWPIAECMINWRRKKERKNWGQLK